MERGFAEGLGAAQRKLRNVARKIEESARREREDKWPRGLRNESGELMVGNKCFIGLAAYIFS